MRTLTTKKGKSVTTPFSDAEALTLLVKVPGNFAADLLSKSHLAKGLSQDQMTWVHVLVVDHNKAPEPGLPCVNIISMFQRAIDSGMKRVCVLFQVDGVSVQFKLAGPNSKYKNQVMITDGGGFGSNKWFGVIDCNDDWKPTRQADQKLIDVVKKIESDPVKFAKLSGALTGNCCFCKLPLSTRESVGAGYGPKCASRFGLPWGEVSEYEAKKSAIASV